MRWSISILALVSTLATLELAVVAAQTPSPVVTPKGAVLPTKNTEGVTSGQMDATFEVTPDGAATYTIPLWVPPGRNGLQPELALQYHSRGGYGVLGVGWRLSGLSRITRCQKNFLHDQEPQPVLFDNSGLPAMNDSFCLDGERLVPAQGQPGQSGTEYRTRHNTFAKIRVETTDALGPTSFLMFEQNGRILTFQGDQPSSRLIIGTLGPAPSNVVETPQQVRYSWSLTKVEDRAGNQMDVTYKSFQKQGWTNSEYLPVEIAYTSFPGPTAPSTPLRSVKFTYGEQVVADSRGSRLEGHMEYLSGLQIPHFYYLETIEMWGPPPLNVGISMLPSSLLRLYEIYYGNPSVTGRRLIEAIRECDGYSFSPPNPFDPTKAAYTPPLNAKMGSCKNSHVFEWEAGSVDFEEIDTGIGDVKATPGGRSNLSGRLQILDFNGDGRDDVLYLPGTTINQYSLLLSTGNSDSPFSAPIALGIQLPHSPTNLEFGRPSPLDFDMNGEADLLVFDDSQHQIPGSDCCVVNQIYMRDPNATSPTLAPTQTLDAEVAQAVDLNGDRIPDILTSPLVTDPTQPSRPWYIQLNKVGALTTPPVLLGQHLSYESLRFIDLDGDGAAEILSEDNDPNLSLYQCSNRQDPDDHVVPPLDCGHHFVAYQVARTDQIDPATRQPTGQVKGPSYTTLFTNQQYVFTDLNGDGLADAVSRNGKLFIDRPNGSADPQVSVNTGNGFLAPTLLPTPFKDDGTYTGVPGAGLEIDYTYEVVRVIDYDGDGQQDLLLRTKRSHVFNDPTERHDDPLLILRLKESYVDATNLSWNNPAFVSTTLPVRSAWIKPEEVDLIEVLDANGDGLDDIIMFTSPEGAKPSLHLYLRKGKKPDLLTEILVWVEEKPPGALGTRIEIDYSPLVSPVYKLTAPCTYPQSCNTSGLWVVDAHSEDNGNGGANSYSYMYEDGRTDLRGQGFLGFLTTWVVNNQSDAITYSTYDLDRQDSGLYSLVGLPTRVIHQVPLDKDFYSDRIISTNYEVKIDATAQAIFPFAQVIEDREEEIRGNITNFLRSVSITKDYDEYGNITLYDEVFSGGAGRNTTKISHDNQPDVWLIQRIDLVDRKSTSSTGEQVHRRAGYEYDSLGFVSKIVIEPGPKTSAGYTALDSQSDGVKTLFISFVRSPEGLPTQITQSETADPSASSTSRVYVTTYDAFEQMFPSTITNPLGQKRSITFHPGLGVPIVTQDENNLRTFFNYDGFGRLLQRVSPDGNNVSISYQGMCGPDDNWTFSNAVFCVSQKLDSGPQVITAYDSRSRPVTKWISARDDKRIVINQFKYDDRGRLTGQSLPRFFGEAPVFTEYGYDNLDRVLTKQMPGGATVTFTYIWPETHVVDSNLHERYVSVDAQALIIESTALGSLKPRRTSYVYGPFRTLNKINAQGGYHFTMKYDRLGRVIQREDKDRGMRTFSYNAFGEMTEEVQPSGEKVQYLYDSLGRLTDILTLKDSIKYVWDLAVQGKVAQVVSHDAHVQYLYDALGRPAGKLWSLQTIQGTYGYSYTYDAVGRLAEIKYLVPGSPGLAIKYGYGNFGELTIVSDSASGLPYWLNVKRDPSGIFGVESFGNGVRTQNIPNPSRPDTLQQILSQNKQGAILQNLIFNFDGNYSLVDRQDLNAKTHETFSYDMFDRLEQWVWTRVDIQQVIYDYRWHYDDWDNITEREEVGGMNNRFFGYDPKLDLPPLNQVRSGVRISG